MIEASKAQKRRLFKGRKEGEEEEKRRRDIQNKGEDHNIQNLRQGGLEWKTEKGDLLDGTHHHSGYQKMQ